VSLVYGFTKAAPKGLQDSAHWTEPNTLVWFAAAVVLLTAFFAIETRASNPLLPMRVLLDRNRGASYLVSLITGIGLFAMFLFLCLYLQVILHYSPVKAGFAFLPFSLGIIMGAGIAAQLLPRVGPKPLIVPGLIAGSVGLLLLTRLTPDSEYASHVLAPTLIISVGMAFVFIPVASTALHGIGHHDAGVGSAMINTSQQVGGSLGTRCSTPSPSRRRRRTSPRTPPRAVRRTSLPSPRASPERSRSGRVSCLPQRSWRCSSSRSARRLCRRMTPPWTQVKGATTTLWSRPEADPPTPKRGRPRAPEWERRLLPQEAIPPKRLRTSDSR